MAFESAEEDLTHIIERPTDLVIHPYAFAEGMLARLRLLSDTHIKLRTGRFRSKLVHMMDVVKVNKVEAQNDGPVTFQVEPGTGMRTLPMSSVRA